MSDLHKRLTRKREEADLYRVYFRFGCGQEVLPPVERCFALITGRAIRRDTDKSRTREKSRLRAHLAN